MKIWRNIRGATKKKESQNLWVARNLSNLDSVKKYAMLSGEQATKYLGVCSESHDGYIRQEAVKYLGLNARPGSVQFVLPRLGDWVPQVRDEARLAIASLIDAGYCNELIEHYNLILSMSRIRRVDLTGQIQELEDAIRSPQSIDQLWATLDSPLVSIRRFGFSLLVHHKENHSRLIERAMCDRDPAIRFWLLRAYLNGEIKLSQQIIQRLIHDPSPRVCVTLIRSFTDEQIQDIHDDLIGLLASASQPIRREASFYLIKKCGFDVLAHARVLVVRSPTPGAIEIVGELGDTSDRANILRFLSDESPRIRRSAVLSVSWLSKDSEFIEVFIEAIQDPYAKVRLAASNALRSRPVLDWYTPIFNAFLKDQSMTAFSPGHLLVKLAGWDCVPVALVFLQSGQSNENARLGVDILIEWVRKTGVMGWIQPRVEVVQLIEPLWPTTNMKPGLHRHEKLYWLEAVESIERMLNNRSL